MDELIALIKEDRMRTEALGHVAEVSLPQCYIAAGFVRNLVWDSLHGFVTPLNDVDVIYFDPIESNPDAYLQYEAHLKAHMPQFNWQVRNFAEGEGEFQLLVVIRLIGENYCNSKFGDARASHRYSCEVSLMFCISDCR